MSNTGNDREGKILFVHRTTAFDRSLEELRRKGGTASMAAKKADKILSLMTQTDGKDVRERFKYTHNGEYRIKYCRKYDLGSGYRLVVLRRGQHLVLLFAGSHDDCFRWIEHNKEMDFEIDDTTDSIPVRHDARSNDSAPDDVPEEEPFMDEYEAALMNTITDDVLQKIFSGLTKRQHPGE